MSHFAVLVAVPQDKTLENVMLPFHEYECTGIEEYTQFVIYDLEKLNQEFREHGKDAKNLEDFARDWAGLVPDSNGNFGKVTNPNAKWDWYQIGGRWSSYLTGNSGTKQSLELSKKQALNVSKSLENYDKWHASRAEAVSSQKDIERCKELLEKNWKNNQDAQEMYANPEDFGKDNIAFNSIGDDWWSTDDAKEMRMERSEFEKRKRGQSLVHSFIDLDGKWHERGDMGWWGMCNDENENIYDGENGEFWTWINSLSGDTVLYLVDCHI